MVEMFRNCRNKATIIKRPYEIQKRIISIFFLLAFSFSFIHGFGHIVSETREQQCVILLHGLARSSRSMDKLEKKLTAVGYSVLNVDYEATKFTIDFLAERALTAVIDQQKERSPAQIHFVTHSMGGILVRYYLKHHKLPNLGRVVMISPPNHGAELVDRFKNVFFFKTLHGPAGGQLGTDDGSILSDLGPIDFELGVIAGNKSFNPIYSWLIPGPDDGVVSVESTKIQGMTDFVVLPYSHTFIMKSDGVIDQIIHFLEKGFFRDTK